MGDRKRGQEREEAASQQRERAVRSWTRAVDGWAQRDRASVLALGGGGCPEGDARRSESVLVWGCLEGGTSGPEAEAPGRERGPASPDLGPQEELMGCGETPEPGSRPPSSCAALSRASGSLPRAAPPPRGARSPAEVQEGPGGGRGALCRPAEEVELRERARLLGLHVLQVEAPHQEVLAPDVLRHQVHLRGWGRRPERGRASPNPPGLPGQSRGSPNCPQEP